MVELYVLKFLEMVDHLTVVLTDVVVVDLRTEKEATEMALAATEEEIVIARTAVSVTSLANAKSLEADINRFLYRIKKPSNLVSRAFLF